MKVNIDLREVFAYYGIANFKRNITERLSRFEDINITGCYNWTRAVDRVAYKKLSFKVHGSYIPEKLVYRYDLTRWISYETIMSSEADLNIFLTYNVPQVRFKSPLISTIHDIIVLKTNAESEEFKHAHENILRHTIAKSQHVLTVSESAKADLIEYFNLSPDYIDIVHNGIVLSQFEEELTDYRKTQLIEKYGLPDNFILYFGGYRAHKNIERLLQAYALLPPKTRKELKLVVTNKHPKLLELATQLKIDGDIVFTSFIDEKDKCCIYKFANMVYYASLYEGFGVPVIESQICETPVITSNTSSLPEASGGYAQLVDPYSIDEIYQAILELWNDNQRREFLTTHGVENAKKYTWDKGAQELHDVLIRYK